MDKVDNNLLGDLAQFSLEIEAELRSMRLELEHKKKIEEAEEELKDGQ